MELPAVLLVTTREASFAGLADGEGGLGPSGEGQQARVDWEMIGAYFAVSKN